MDDLTATVSASGLDLHVHRGTDPGAGPPIVALHPWFGCWQFWLPIVERMPERDWLLVDMYSGARAIAADDEALPHLASAVTELVAERCDGPVVLMGNSTGGLIAQILAISGVPPLEALVLVGTGASAAGVKPPFRATLGDWLAANGSPEPELTRAAVRSLLFTTPDPEPLRTYCDAVTDADLPFLSAVLSGVLAADVIADLPRIGVPTLVVRGAEDAARTTEHVRILREGIPDCRTVEIPQAGHSPMVDTPDEFAGALRGFLAGTAAGTAR